MNDFAKRFENFLKPNKIKEVEFANNTGNNDGLIIDDTSGILLSVANEKHLSYVDDILETVAEAAKIRGTGIARRSPEYVKRKIFEGKAIIALDSEKFVGFCYIESWGHEKFVANSGLIVVDEYRGKGLAKKIKNMAFNLSRKKFPNAKIFGLTTGLAVMKINSELGYKPVPFSELTDDDDFWKGCESCINHDILMRTKRKHCLCTGMLYDPEWEKEINKNIKNNNKKLFKNSGLLLKFKKII